MENFNSEWWFEPLEGMASAFYKKADKELVIYRKSSFDAVKQMYGLRLRSVKENMYGQGINPENKVDHHKIVALYLQLFSENPVFVIKPSANGLYPSVASIFANEHYCLEVVRVVLESWAKKTFNRARFGEYRVDFMKLLANYRKSHTEAANTPPHFSYKQVDKYPQSFHFTHALAHLIYFIERDFMD